jgi:iron complex outermembrane receptor protein
VVTASRYEEPRSSASAVVDVIGRDEIQASGATNIVEFLESVAGVSVNRLYGRLGVDASLDIGFFGEAGSQNVLVLIDGQRLNTADSSSIRFVQTPISSIERIEVRKANGGVLYGDRAQGGVVNIITRRGSARELRLGFGSFDTRSADVYLGFEEGAWSGSISGLTAESDGDRDFSASEQTSSRAELQLRLPKGQFSMDARIYRENVQLPSNLSKEQFEANPRQVGASPMTSKRDGDAVSLRYESASPETTGYSLELSRQSSKDFYASRFGSFGIENQRVTLTPEFHRVGPSTRWILGAEIYSAESKTVDRQSIEQDSYSLYAQVSRSFFQRRLTLDLGGRRQEIENTFQPNESGPTSQSRSSQNAATLGARIRLGDDSMLRLGVLTGYRFANADELYFYYFNPDDFLDPRNYNLLSINSRVKPMRSREAYLAASTRWGSIAFEAQFRRMKTLDEIGLEFRCGTVLGDPVACNTNLYDTERDVLTLETMFPISASLRARLALDFVDATIESGADRGRQVPLTPKKVARVSLEKAWSGLMVIASAHVRDSMAQAADQANQNSRIPSRGVVDLGLVGSPIKGLTLSVWARNLRDKVYYDYASFNGIYPADGRSFELSGKLEF